MKRVRAVAASIAACLLVGACGQAEEPARAPIQAPAGSPSGAPTQAPAGSPSRVPTGAPSLTAAPATPIPTGAPAAPITISGTVQAGVEANCLLLKGYLLVGGRDEGVRAGAKVTVTGRARSDLLTTCQQGTPLQVETVRPG
jgi:hypothetical protein